MVESTWEIGKDELAKQLEERAYEAQDHAAKLEREIAGLLVSQALSREMGLPEDPKAQIVYLTELRAELSEWAAKLDVLRQMLAKLDSLERPADFPA